MSKNLHQTTPKNSTRQVVTIKAASSKEFGRILSKLNSFENGTYVFIRDSIINQPVTDTRVYVEIDLSRLIGGGVNMEFMLNNSDLKSVNRLLSSGTTSIVHDTDANAYLFQTSYQTQKLTAIDGVDNTIPSAPVFTDDQHVGLEVTIDDIADIRGYLGKTSFARLLVYDDQLEQILSNISESPYTLKQDGAGSLAGKRPDMAFTCPSFLTIANKDTKIRLVKNEEGMWLLTETKMSAKSGVMKIYQLLIEIPLDEQ